MGIQDPNYNKSLDYTEALIRGHSASQQAWGRFRNTKEPPKTKPSPDSKGIWKPLIYIASRSVQPRDVSLLLLWSNVHILSYVSSVTFVELVTKWKKNFINVHNFRWNFRRVVCHLSVLWFLLGWKLQSKGMANFSLPSSSGSVMPSKHTFFHSSKMESS